MAADITTIIIPFKLPRRGHQSHTTGSGKHYDRRTKRNRTRGSKNHTAIREFS